MTKELDIRTETLNYLAAFARPAFSLWGQGGKITEGLYDALSPFGASLPTFQATPTLPNASTALLTIGIGNSGTLKFAYDRLEFTFTDFTTDFFQSLPRLFSACADWLRASVPKFQFATHDFGYFSHSYIKGTTTEEILAMINPQKFKSAGLALGHGAIFHHAIPETKWRTRLILDRSAQLPDALFLGLNLTLTRDSIEYDKFLVDGRAYLASILEELDLSLPDFSQPQ